MVRFSVEAVGQIGANNSKPGPHRKTPAHLVNLDRPLEGDRSPQTAPTGTRKNSSTHDKFAKQRLPPPGAPVLVSHRAPLPSDRSPTDYGPVSGRTMMIDRPHRDDAQPLRERTVSQPIAVTRQVPVRDRRMSNTARATTLAAIANMPLLSLKADPPSKYAAVEPSRAPESAPRSAKEVADSHFRKISLSKASEVPTLRVDSVPIPTVGPDVVPPAAPALTTAAPATPANAALPDMQTVDNTMDSHVTSPPRLGVSAVIAEAPPIGPSANEPAQYVSGVQSRKSSLSSASESRLYGEEVMNCRDERAYLRPSSPPRYRSMSRQPSADSQWSGRSREGSSRLIGSFLREYALCALLMRSTAGRDFLPRLWICLRTFAFILWTCAIGLRLLIRPLEPRLGRGRRRWGHRNAILSRAVSYLLRRTLFNSRTLPCRTLVAKSFKTGRPRLPFQTMSSRIAATSRFIDRPGL